VKLQLKSLNQILMQILLTDWRKLCSVSEETKFWVTSLPFFNIWQIFYFFVTMFWDWSN